ncbi:hypothetical protein Fcan01_26712 [Folsomia candida]|uniref:Uncharacterized protein n=1 Tax=Folsomia candida TaxID=158441 RepID=A0A226D001_FOLCA|nr:hypothetical protein Fcan01_26712 [Folsomia candida]
MKRNNETSGDDNSNPSPVSKFMRLDLAAQQSSSALENPEGHGRGIVVTSSTEGTSSSSDPFCLTDLRASISSILPPTLASPPRPPRPKSRRGWSTDFVHRFEDTESTCDTQTSSDVISILSGNLITPPSNVTVHTTRERNFLDSGSPLTGSEGAMGGRKRARSSLATGKLESWANTVDSCSETETVSNLAKNEYFYLSTSPNPSSQSTTTFSHVDKFTLKPVSRKLDFEDMENTPPLKNQQIEDSPPPPRDHTNEDPVGSIHLLWDSHLQNNNSNKATPVDIGQPAAASTPMSALQRPGNNGRDENNWGRQRSVLEFTFRKGEHNAASEKRLKIVAEPEKSRIRRAKDFLHTPPPNFKNESLKALRRRHKALVLTMEKMYKGEGYQEAGRLPPHAVQKARDDNHVPSLSANSRSSNAKKSPQLIGNKKICPNVKEALRKKLTVGRGADNHVHSPPAKAKKIFPCKIKKCPHTSTNATSARLHARTHLTSDELENKASFFHARPEEPRMPPLEEEIHPESALNYAPLPPRRLEPRGARGDPLNPQDTTKSDVGKDVKIVHPAPSSC